jgi:hypothetical protein
MEAKVSAAARSPIEHSEFGGKNAIYRAAELDHRAEMDAAGWTDTIPKGCYIGLHDDYTNYIPLDTDDLAKFDLESVMITSFITEDVSDGGKRVKAVFVGDFEDNENLYYNGATMVTADRAEFKQRLRIMPPISGI